MNTRFLLEMKGMSVGDLEDRLGYWENRIANGPEGEGWKSIVETKISMIKSELARRAEQDKVMAFNIEMARLNFEGMVVFDETHDQSPDVRFEIKPAAPHTVCDDCDDDASWWVATQEGPGFELWECTFHLLEKLGPKGNLRVWEGAVTIKEKK